MIKNYKTVLIQTTDLSLLLLDQISIYFYSINYEFVPSPLPSRYCPNVPTLQWSIVPCRYPPWLTVTYRYFTITNRYSPLLIVNSTLPTVTHRFSSFLTVSNNYFFCLNFLAARNPKKIYKKQSDRIKQTINTLSAFLMPPTDISVAILWSQWDAI